MQKFPALVMEYDPIGRNISFKIRTRYENYVALDDSESLKEYENEPGIFSLEGLHDKIFAFMEENFDGEAEVGIELKVNQASFEQKQAEIVRFEEAVEKFNRFHEMQLRLKIVKKLLDQDAVGGQSGVAGQESEPHKARKQLKIAVVGRTDSGKTELIRGLTAYLGSVCEIGTHCNDVMKYFDSRYCTEWYEVAGVDFNVQAYGYTDDLLYQLIQEGINTILYCVNGRIGRFGGDERDFITSIKDRYPDIKVLVVVTSCFGQEHSRELADIIYASTKHTETFMVLARRVQTRAGCIDAFGLDKLAEKIYGG